MRIRKPLPFAFVLEELERLDPLVRPMFGCHALYVGPRIVLILREKAGSRSDSRDNGIWLATTTEHHVSLRKEFPSLRSISALGSGVTGWQVLPASSDSFEEDALRVCGLVLRGDPRIGKIPKPKKPRKAKTTR